MSTRVIAGAGLQPQWRTTASLFQASRTDSPTALRAEPIRTEAALRALVPEWEVLAAGIAPWTPFITPSWNITHWKHFRRSRLMVRDVLHGYVVRDGGGRLVAIAPMMLTLHPGYGPLRLRELHYFGADPNVTEIRGIICRPEDERGAVSALNDVLRRAQGSWDLLHWGGLRRDERACADVMATATLVAERTIPDFYIELPQSFEAFRAQLPRNTKEALRKCYNSLKRDGHAFAFDVVTSPHEVDAALDVFFRLHTARAEADYGVVHADAFIEPKVQDFLREYALGSAQRGELRIFRLRIGELVVAMRIGFCTGDDLYLYYSGHLPDYGRYSVMTTTVAEALKWAIGAGVRRVNLSVGRDRSKLRWRPLEVPFWEAFQSAPTVRGRLMAMLFQRKIRDLAYWHPATAVEAAAGDEAPG